MCDIHVGELLIGAEALGTLVELEGVLDAARGASGHSTNTETLNHGSSGDGLRLNFMLVLGLNAFIRHDSCPFREHSLNSGMAELLSDILV